MNNSEINFYELLQVHYKADSDVIKKAYYTLIQKNHPDKGGSDEVTKKLNEAYNILINEDSRKKYDEEIGISSQKINDTNNFSSKEIVLKDKEKTSEITSYKNKYMIEFILFGMYLTFGLSWISTVPMSTEINQFLGVDKLQGARIFTIISAAKSVFPILAGILAAKIGLRNALKISAILIMAGLAVPFLPNYYMWIVTRFAFGVGGAMWVTLMGATAMQIFPAHQRPIVNALNGIAVNAGFALALRYTLKIQESLGWQNTMTLYSLISAVFAIMLFVFGSSIPSEKSNSSSSEESYLKTLKMPLTWIISVAFTGPLAIYLVFNGLLPIYYQEVFNIPKLQTMQWISLINLWGIPSSIATGFLLQRFGRCKPFILAASILLPAVSLSSVLISNTSIMSIMLPLTGIGMFLSVSPLITLTQNQKGMTPKLMGMVLGTMFSVTYIVSSAIPEIIGFFNRSGVPLGTLLSIACILTISPAISLLLPEKEKEV